jgi:hypothetical protein
VVNIITYSYSTSDRINNKSLETICSNKIEWLSLLLYKYSSIARGFKPKIDWKINPLGSHVSNTICRKAMDYSLGPKNPKLFMRFDSTMSFISETRVGYKEWSSALPVSSVFFPDQLPKWSKRKPGPDQYSGQQTGPSQGSELCDPRIVNQQTVHLYKSHSSKLAGEMWWLYTHTKFWGNRKHLNFKTLFSVWPKGWNRNEGKWAPQTKFLWFSQKTMMTKGISHEIGSKTVR